MTKIWVCGTFLILSFLLSLPLRADLKIAVIGKTKNDSFYEQAYKGCQSFAATAGDIICVYDGPNDYQNPRAQAAIVDRALAEHADGILISTTNSEFLVERVLRVAREKHVPVITFDSDLLPEHRSYRLAYVGTNNFDFGVALGNVARRFGKELGREICIQSGSDATPNLNERIRGVRYALSGNQSNRKLSGENGWTEHHRCPFYTLGKRENALNQLKFLFAQSEPPLFLAVAGFAQFSPHYIEEMATYRNRIESGDLVVISADAEAMQLQALAQHLSTANIGQRPFDMGYESARLMYAYLKQNRRPAQEVNYLGFYYCTAEAGEVLCTDGDE